MPEVQTTIGMQVEYKAESPAGQPWGVLLGVVGMSSTEATVPLSVVTGKSDLVEQYSPGRMIPGTLSFTVQMSQQPDAQYTWFKNSLNGRRQYSIRVNCGTRFATSYWLVVTGAWLKSVGIPTSSSGDMLQYPVTFQLSDVA
jgi:hypothetical protein